MAEPKDLLLGELALRRGLLTEEQLDACIQQQIDERFRRPLGEILLEKGGVAPGALQEILEAQRSAIEEFEKKAEYGELFGRIALSRGIVTMEGLTKALRAQARKHARGVSAKLGQVFMELNLITIKQFWQIIHEQGDFTCGTCGQLIQNPVFRAQTVVCENCKAPAFQVNLDSSGPKPRHRRKP